MQGGTRSASLSIVEGVLEEFGDGRFVLSFTRKGRVLLVVEGVAKVDNPDVIVTNARRYWFFEAQSKQVKFYKVPKEIRLKLKNRPVRVIVEVLEVVDGGG